MARTWDQLSAEEVIVIQDLTDEIDSSTSWEVLTSNWPWVTPTFQPWWAGSWDVKWPTWAVDENIATYDWATWKVIKDGGSTISDVLNMWNMVETATEKIMTDVERTKLAWIWDGADVVWPASAVDSNVAVYDSTTWKLIKDWGFNLANVLDTDNHTRWTTNTTIKITEKDALNLSSSNTRLTGWDVTATPWGTTFDYTSGTGYHIDVNTGVRTEVSWTGATNVPITNIATTNVTAIWVDKNGVIVQSDTPITPTDIRNNIYFDYILHTWGSVNDVTAATLTWDFSVASQLSDLAEVFGTLNISGNILWPNGVNMNLDLSAWKVFRHLANIKADKKDPSTIAFAWQTALNFISTWKDGSGWYNIGWPSTALLSWVYDDGTGWAGQPNGNVPNNRYMNYHAFLWLNWLVFLQYWETLYTNITDARVGWPTESLSKNPELSWTLALGWISVKGNATNLSNESQAVFTAWAGISSWWTWAIFTRQAVYDVSIQPQTVTSAWLGADTWRGGTWTDTDTIMEWQNNAGTTTASIDGNGLISWSNLSWNNTGDQSWGDITWTLSNQTDLQTALDGKMNKLTSSIDNRIIRANWTWGENTQISQLLIEDDGTLTAPNDTLMFNSTTGKASFFGAADNFGLNVKGSWLNARMSFQWGAWDNPWVQLQNDTSWNKRVLWRLNESGSNGTEMQWYTRNSATQNLNLNMVLQDDGTLNAKEDVIVNWELSVWGDTIVTDLWNVGIWTANPNAKLHLSDSWFVVQTIESTTADPVLQLTSDATSVNNDWTMRMDVSAWDNLWFRYDNTTRLVLTPAWELGIGTSIPESELNVATWWVIQVGASTDGSYLRMSANDFDFNRAWGASYLNQSGVGWSIRIRTSEVTENDTTAITVQSNGNVGFWVSGPSEKIEVNWDIKADTYTSREAWFAANQNKQIVVASTSNATNIRQFSMNHKSDSGWTFRLWFDYQATDVSTPSEVFTISNTGDVSIWTWAAATAKLEIGWTSWVDWIKFPDGTLQTTAAGGWGWWGWMDMANSFWGYKAFATSFGSWNNWIYWFTSSKYDPWNNCNWNTYTCPADGWYKLDVQLAIDDISQDTLFELRYQLNGWAASLFAQMNLKVGVSTIQNLIKWDVFLELASWDTIQLRGTSTNGSITIAANTWATKMNYMSVYKMT